jgi:FkbM family methyltransferase
VLHALARTVPLSYYYPLRRGAVALRRGSLPRSACIAVLKLAATARRGRLAGELSEIRPLDLPEVTFRPIDSMVMDAVYWFGVQGYEGKLADVWVNFCGHARSVLEVGGNVGLFSVIGARATAGRYSVVEPVPGIAAVLRDNLLRNGLGRVEVIQGAAIAAETPREVVLSIPDEGRAAPVGSHLIEGVEISGRSSAAQIRVAGVPFRSLVAGRDLIKIDAEGIEAELLSAARDIILAERPTLVIELLPSATKLAALLGELARVAGYAIHIVPQWGSDTIVTIAAETLTADMPSRHNAKDVVLSRIAL